MVYTIGMLTTIQDEVKTLLPTKRKHNSTSGWISFNAPCCVHNGESADTRSRGGLMANADGSVSYHCFNCHFKTSYKPGRHLTYKFKKLLSWFGADDNTIKRLTIDALRIKELVNPESIKLEPEEEVSFKVRPLPENSVSFSEWKTFLSLQDADEPIHPQFVDAFNYVYQRRIDLEKYEFYTTDTDDYNLHKRVIVPFYWKGELIGNTARAFEEGIKPKYYSDYEPNFVFNMDNQVRDNTFVLVMEGPFDAMAVDGVAVLSNECSEVQADIIDSLGKEVILVPDFDVKIVKGKPVWAGEALLLQAIEYGWSVSFPVWREEVKDVSEAVVKYGKLFTMKSILDGKISNKLKIELMRKKYNA